MKGYAAVALLSSLSATTVAGSITGFVQYVAQRASDGLTMVGVTGVPFDKPGCATQSYWVIRDENSESGKKQYAMLLAAKASGLRVAINGSNACVRWGDGEDIDLIQLVD